MRHIKTELDMVSAPYLHREIYLNLLNILVYFFWWFEV